SRPLWSSRAAWDGDASRRPGDQARSAGRVAALPAPLSRDRAAVAHDLDAVGGIAGQAVELLDTDMHATAARVDERKLRQPLGEGLDQVHARAARQGLDGLDQVLVIDDAGVVVADRHAAA